MFTSISKVLFFTVANCPPPPVLDIAKHTELYLSALGLLYSFTLHPSLLSLLTLPIFPASGDPPSMTSSSDGRGGLSLVGLSRRLKSTVMSYSKAARYTYGTNCATTTNHVNKISFIL